MVFIKIVAILVGLTGLQICCGSDDLESLGKLVLANVIYRHGARAPVYSYPNDPYLDQTVYWPRGYGQLTQLGEQMHFELGSFFRQRYSSLLPLEYNVNDTYIRSTDVDRTLMSAQSNLAGLYPALDEETTDKIFWQDIPIHTVDEDNDEDNKSHLSHARYTAMTRNTRTLDSPVRSLDTQVRSLDTQVHTLDTQVRSLDTQVRTLDTPVHSLDTQVRTLDTQVRSLDTQVHTLDTQVRSLDTQVHTLDTPVHSLDTQVHTLDTQVRSLDTQVRTLDTPVHSLDTQVHTLDTQVRSLDTQVHTLDTPVHSLDTQVHTLDTQVRSLDTQVRTLDTPVHSLDTQVHTLDTQVRSLDTQVHTLDTPVHSLDTQVHTLDTQVRSLDTQVRTLDTPVHSHAVHTTAARATRTPGLFSREPRTALRLPLSLLVSVLPPQTPSAPLILQSSEKVAAHPPDKEGDRDNKERRYKGQQREQAGPAARL
uniref:acid phosphatase n=1 Tax=Timema shepardi TaxID=629360 RepID=A0A7R9AVX6_TIMSH|nr:unnamed protein product [Timema shepardi]